MKSKIIFSAAILGMALLFGGCEADRSNVCNEGSTTTTLPAGTTCAKHCPKYYTCRHCCANTGGGQSCLNSCDHLSSHAGITPANGETIAAAIPPVLRQAFEEAGAMDQLHSFLLSLRVEEGALLAARLQCMDQNEADGLANVVSLLMPFADGLSNSFAASKGSDRNNVNENYYYDVFSTLGLTGINMEAAKGEQFDSQMKRASGVLENAKLCS